MKPKPVRNLGSNMTTKMFALLMVLGDIALDQHNYYFARERYSEALAIAPTDKDAQRGAARARRRMGEVRILGGLYRALDRETRRVYE